MVNGGSGSGDGIDFGGALLPEDDGLLHGILYFRTGSELDITHGSMFMDRESLVLSQHRHCCGPSHIQ